MYLTNFLFYNTKNYLNTKPVKGLRGCGLGYRFAFNGQEKDDEVSGAGNTMSATFWEYDCRLGRRWNVDPESEENPDFSPYVCLGDNPILNEDPDGDIWHIAAGAGIGAAIGGLFEAGHQIYSTGSVSNWSAVGGAMVQGAITGGFAAATGGASLSVSVGAKIAIVGASATAANVAGGTANRAMQGKATTAKDVAIDAAVGIVGAGVGHVVGKVVTKVLAQSSKMASNQIKGKVGEILTQAKYLKKGYISRGNVPIKAASKVRLNGTPRVAQYDHNMKSIIPGKPQLTVESKFNSAKLNSLQSDASVNVKTLGGLKTDRTTNVQAGSAANAIVNGGTGSVGAQTNTR